MYTLFSLYIIIFRYILSRVNLFSLFFCVIYVYVFVVKYLQNAYCNSAANKDSSHHLAGNCLAEKNRAKTPGIPCLSKYKSAYLGL